MENFEFYNPVRMVYGPGEISRTGDEVSALGKTALLVSYENHAPRDDLLADVTAQMESKGMTVVPFYKCIPNPGMNLVREGAEVCRGNKVDVVVGFGGGSVMDIAKLIAIAAKFEGDPVKMIVLRHDVEEAVEPTDALPIILIPTLPATSSEANCGAVVTDEESNIKGYIFHPLIYAKVAILDPELTCGLPAYQTACGAADAISHVMELYLNGADDTPLQDALMEGVLKVTMENVKKALKDPSDVAVRGHLQWTACVAWNGWTTPGTASNVPMHLIAHVLSARFNVTHGASLAIIMPAFMRHTYKERPDRYKQFAENIFGFDTTDKDADTIAKVTIDAFEDFLKEIGVQTRLSDVNIPAKEIEIMTADVVKWALAEDGSLAARPVLGEADVKKIYELAL